METHQAGGLPLAPARPSPTGAESISCIKQIGASLLRGFVWSLLQQQGPRSPPARSVTMEELGGQDTPDGPRVASLRETLHRIWESMSQNPEIDSLVQCMAGQPPLPALAAVSEEVFRDGINWGRVVVFFYFTYRVIAQALGGSDCLRSLVDWALNFLWERVAPWIQRQGGWDSIFSYLTSSA
ncbi:apoptosis regulator BAX-like isoform X1 [Malaclemys terrapin pileata]|uniref:apoptosis regulator BAX-like isoform X1 n=1 Tax=Malaclemys terrapin pileata TaxID=2991368 RepID=UPI0023A7F6B4|nr:apoptosis regulator BAX-like isoform X1 [Malaclemys terrapin pileata]